ncbi:2-oxoacid:acceptor oxidoreductase subunit alpha [Planctomycetota bacterium]
MKADPRAVATGAHYLDGDHACAEGAIAAGCRFFAGYPITPSTEVAERVAQRFPRIGGVFIQMEDEIASITAVLGAAWGGARSMTCTSGPGFSLMTENLGLAYMMEVPCVVVNVQRGSPSTGLPTMVGQADVMQAKWGSHGDYEIIAVAPDSPQEAFELTITAFNLAEKYRTPAVVLLDECVGHMTEKVVIPPADEIELIHRKIETGPKDAHKPYLVGPDLVPTMAIAGDGYRYHTTGLTHDERGYPVMQADCHDKLIRRLREKVRRNRNDMVPPVTHYLDDAEVVVVSYGITSRVARAAVELGREAGHKVGGFRMKLIWPFQEDAIRELAGRVRAFVVPEINLGQISLEVERVVAGRARVVPVNHAGGAVFSPEQILAAIEEAQK